MSKLTRGCAIQQNLVWFIYLVLPWQSFTWLYCRRGERRDFYLLLLSLNEGTSCQWSSVLTKKIRISISGLTSMFKSFMFVTLSVHMDHMEISGDYYLVNLASRKLNITRQYRAKASEWLRSLSGPWKSDKMIISYIFSYFQIQIQVSPQNTQVKISAALTYDRFCYKYSSNSGVGVWCGPTLHG